MQFASRLKGDPNTAALSWLLFATALVCTPAFRLTADTLARALSQMTAPAASAPAPPVDPWAAPPFVLRSASIAERRQAVNCLAAAVYYEAGTQPLEGQRAVAQVVLNRVRDPKFPASICGVVLQRAHRHVCQFSFVCDGSVRRRPPHAAQLASARAVAEQALAGRVVAEVGTATHYHTTYVHPSWAHQLVKVDQIGAHIFYRRSGEAGAPSALTRRYAGGELRVGGLERRLLRL